jgi:hypothetical protein
VPADPWLGYKGRVRVGLGGKALISQRTRPTSSPVRPGQRLRQDGGSSPGWGTLTPGAGQPAAPHGLAVDSGGDLRAEVTHTFAVSRGYAREDCHTFQKFNPKP